ncbi:MAG: hypothetical protein RL625_252 [Gemmatimonadota bacterium]
MTLRRVGLLLVASLLGCRDATPDPAPLTEFIVVASDSVFWVRSEAEGIRVRGAPMMLAQVDGRFHELYVTDDDRSYYDATFLGQHLYTRDLISGDSLRLLSDTVMATLAQAYGRANPDERPLTIDEEGSENPRIMGTADIGILDVHGPWVSFDYLTDVDAVGARSRHSAQQGVLDLRSGTRATLTTLFGAAEATRLASLGFLETSFHIDVIDRAPAVHFTEIQRDAEEPAGVTSLGTEQVERPSWWTSLLPHYPDSVTPNERRWTREGFALRARPAPDGEMRISIALVDEADGEWLLGTVPAPLHRVLWVDPAVAGDSTRIALTKAFNEAALYAEDARVVRGPRAPQRSWPGASPRYASLVVSASRKGTSTVRPSLARRSSPLNASRASRPRSLASRE